MLLLRELVPLLLKQLLLLLLLTVAWGILMLMLLLLMLQKLTLVLLKLHAKPIFTAGLCIALLRKLLLRMNKLLLINKLLLLVTIVHWLLQYNLPLLNFLLKVCHWGIDLLLSRSSRLLWHKLLRLLTKLLSKLLWLLLAQLWLRLPLQCVSSCCH